MSEDWDFYFRSINGTPGSFFVDLGIRESAPHVQRPHLVHVCVYLRSPDDDGMPDREEFAVLDSLEEQLLRTYADAHEAVFVGRVTAAGRRVFYFYAPSADGAEETIASAMTGFPAYEYEYDDRDDTPWAIYRDVLYPAPAAMRWIEDRRLVDVLEAQGDLLTQARDVQHRASFPTAAARAAFVEEVGPLGFGVHGGAENQAAKLPFAVRFVRADRVDLDSIHAVTLELMEKAERHGGDYGGWETTVVKYPEDGGE